MRYNQYIYWNTIFFCSILTFKIRLFLHKNSDSKLIWNSACETKIAKWSLVLMRNELYVMYQTRCSPNTANTNIKVFNRVRGVTQQRKWQLKTKKKPRLLKWISPLELVYIYCSTWTELVQSWYSILRSR